MDLCLRTCSRHDGFGSENAMIEHHSAQSEAIHFALERGFRCVSCDNHIVSASQLQ
jgi:hypothetical protein